MCGWCRRPSWRCRCSSGRSPAEILRPLSVLARSLLLLSPWRVLCCRPDLGGVCCGSPQNFVQARRLRCRRGCCCLSRNGGGTGSGCCWLRTVCGSRLVRWCLFGAVVASLLGRCAARGGVLAAGGIMCRPCRCRGSVGVLGGSLLVLVRLLPQLLLVVGLPVVVVS